MFQHFKEQNFFFSVSLLLAFIILSLISKEFFLGFVINLKNTAFPRNHFSLQYLNITAKGHDFCSLFMLPAFALVKMECIREGQTLSVYSLSCGFSLFEGRERCILR